MNEVNPIQALIDAAEDVITTLMTDNKCKCLNRLHSAIPAAKLYPERIEFLEAALRESTYYIPEDGVCSRTHPAYYRWLGEKENAEVGESAGCGTTSPDAIREAKREAWEEGLRRGWNAFYDKEAFPTDNPYAPPKENTDADQS